MAWDRRPLAERFWAKVQKTDGCWLWTGKHNGHGYGSIYGNGRYQYVHRLSYEMAKGPVPEGLDVGHLCDVRNCVRPDHLQAMTRAENQRDMSRKGRARNMLTDANRAKTHCPRGHPYSPENTRIEKKSRGRVCRICKQASSQRQRASESAAKAS